MLMAIRSLRVWHAGADVDVEVRLYMPEQDEQAWICKYVAQGVDAIQAILLALYPLIAQCSRQSAAWAWLEVKGAPIRGCVVARCTVSGSIAAPRHR